MFEIQKKLTVFKIEIDFILFLFKVGYSKSYPEEGIISCDLSAKKCICKEGYTGDLCQNCPTGYSPIFVIDAFSCTNDQSLIDAYLNSKFGNGPGKDVTTHCKCDLQLSVVS